MSSISNKTNTIKKQEGIKVITETIKKQILEGMEYYSNFYYSVCSFGFYDNYGNKLPPSTIRKYWDKYEVEKTCILIRNIIKEHLCVEQVYVFMERHQPELDSDGDVVKEGRFHLNIITSSIPDSAVEEPNRKCRRLFYEPGRMGIPINQLSYGEDLDQLKIDLLNACCRKADWINKFSGSVNTQILWEQNDVDNVIDYCLKDFINDKVDFTDVICFKASDYYKP